MVSSGVPLLSSTQCSRTLGADERCGSILNVLLALWDGIRVRLLRSIAGTVLYSAAIVDIRLL